MGNLFLLIFVFIATTESAIFFRAHKDYRIVPDEYFHNKHYKQILQNLKITAKDLSDAIGFATNSIEKMHRLEINLNSADIGVKVGTPSKGMYIVSSPNNVSIARAKDALIINKATGFLINRHTDRQKMPMNIWSEVFTNLDYSSTTIGKTCKTVNKICSWKARESPYRMADGSCNSEKYGSRGESNTVYKRLLSPDYLDGVSEFRRSVTKRPLPSPRQISTSLVQSENETAYDITSVVGQWWQFIEQDLSQTAASVQVFTGNQIECCDAGYKLSPRYQHTFCAPIMIPSNDPFYSKQYMNCMSYVRSLPGMRHECNFGPREQVNQATHYMDGSQIYGSTPNRQFLLRSFENGKLRSFNVNGSEYLSLSDDPMNDCQFNNHNGKCFKSGDSRVNVHPYMTTLHLLWHREHNRIAEELLKLNPQWNDETIFQEARRIVVAELQHITYDDYLPIILGNEKSKVISKLNDYNPEEDARVTNSFATAALRAFNSLIDDTLNLYNEERNVESSLDLEKHFNKPDVLLEKDMVDKLIRSLGTQLSQKQDVNYANDILSKLYTNGEYGLDVLSLDIQRGRDHGLRSYVYYKNICSKNEAKRFEHFEDVMSQEAFTLLSKIYSHHKDVDLIVGGLLERPEEGAQVGATFSCIIADQMYRTRIGDRYFYKNRNQPKPFTSEQIKEIEKSSLARVMCDNSDVDMMQPDAFRSISETNKLKKCNDLPSMNLAKWKE